MSAAALSASLLLAVAGGFLFAFMCLRARYPSLRGEGQQLYLFAVAFAVPLLLVSRIVFWVADLLLPRKAQIAIIGVWEDIAGPLNTPALPTFILAFVLGPLAAMLWNSRTDKAGFSANVVEVEGSQLEKFLYDAMLTRRLLFVALENRKVYVGWAISAPIPRPLRWSIKEHLMFLPARSGYLDGAAMKPEYTTEYGTVYAQIIEGSREVRGLKTSDFQIVILLEQLVVVRPWSLDLNPEMFVFPASGDSPRDAVSHDASGSAPTRERDKMSGRGFTFWSPRMNAFFVRHGKKK